MITVQMDSRLSTLFSSETGASIYSSVIATVDRYAMREKLLRGVLVGLSGGADSVMLLCTLIKYAADNGAPAPVAVHINHLIRGEEAYRDEALSRRLAEELGAEFIAFKIDVPRLARERGVGLEECARDVRYSKFADIISGRDDISTVAVAHNKDDNAETVIFNIMRGAGTRGAAGIPPVRDNVIRPLISVSKADIISALDGAGIPYVTDSTNLTTDYDRNYIRHKIIPSLAKLGRDVSEQLMRLSENLRCDDDYISSVAEKFITAGDLSCGALLRLHSAPRTRVIMRLAQSAGVSVSAVQISAISSLLSDGNFSYSLGGGISFVAERGICSVRRDSAPIDYNFRIEKGRNVLTGLGAELLVTDTPPDKFSLNIYKKSIQGDLSSAIINGSLSLAPKRDGDTVYFGGMTHKLKKLYNDRGIPPSLRPTIPVLSDESGVLWIPGIGVRDDGVREHARGPIVTLCLGRVDDGSDSVLRWAEKFK